MSASLTRRMAIEPFSNIKRLFEKISSKLHTTKSKPHSLTLPNEIKLMIAQAFIDDNVNNAYANHYGHIRKWKTYPSKAEKKRDHKYRTAVINLYDALPELRYDIEKIIESKAKAVHSETESFDGYGRLGIYAYDFCFDAANDLLSHIFRQLNERRPVVGSRRSWFVDCWPSIGFWRWD